MCCFATNSIARKNSGFILLEQEKVISYHFYYSEIEALILEERNEEHYMILQLYNEHCQASQQKTFLFECMDLDDLAKCLEFYAPPHAMWLRSMQNWRHRKVRVHGSCGHAGFIGSCKTHEVRLHEVRGVQR